MIFKVSVFLTIFFTSFLVQAGQYFYLSKKKENKIEQYILNTEGELKLVGQLELIGGPGSLSLSPDRKYLFFSISTEGSSELGTAKIGPEGKLSLLGKAPMQNGGSGAISKCGSFYFKYHYAKNQVSVLEMKDYIYTGRQIQEVKTTRNPHDIGISNDGSLVFVPHNRHNRIYQFRLDIASGKLSPLTLPYVEGADFDKKGFSAFRSLAFHPKQNVVYCTYEKGGGIASFKYNSMGLEIWQELSTTEKGNSVLPTVVSITPDNSYLYVPNRGKNKSGSSIAAFKLNSQTGEILNRVGIYHYPAIGPRSMVIDNTGNYLFTSSVHTDSTFQFEINKDGSLKLLKEHKIGSGSMLILKD